MLGQVAMRMAFVPNSMKVMAHWPEMLAAFAGFGGVILGGGVLDPGLNQLLAFVTSNAPARPGVVVGTRDCWRGHSSCLRARTHWQHIIHHEPCLRRLRETCTADARP